MTTDELKKEAEDNKPPYAFCALDTKCELWKDGFQKGAEFGYNKGKTETALLSQHILDLQKDKGNLTDRVRELEQQIEKIIDFVLSKTECCDVCPITDTCINSEGTCPYAGILSKGEEAVTREWLMQKIAKEIKEND